MILIDELIEFAGFKKVNYSTWRLENMTLQNGTKTYGDNIIDRIINSKKAYKMCIDGKYFKMLDDSVELAKIISNNLKTPYAWEDIHQRMIKL